MAEQQVQATGGQRGAEQEPAALQFIRKHERRLMWAGAAVVLAIFVVWWTLAARQRKELAGDQALQRARITLQSGDLAQGVSSLNGVIDGFGGTMAANQAALLLNEVRLTEGQAALAAQELERFAPSAPPALRAQAFRLLGVARENTGNPAGAAEAYGRAADHARGSIFGSRLLLDAARAHAAAGDSVLAVAALERVLADSTSPVVAEARVRLGELSAKGLRR